MSMFDYVDCEVALPDGSLSREFQTKDLDCNLNRYKITTYGRLHCHERSETDTFIYKDTSYDGTFTFYDMSSGYTALFEEGQLINIVELDIEDVRSAAGV